MYGLGYCCGYGICDFDLGFKWSLLTCINGDEIIKQVEPEVKKEELQAKEETVEDILARIQDAYLKEADTFTKMVEDICKEAHL